MTEQNDAIVTYTVAEVLAQFGRQQEERWDRVDRHLEHLSNQIETFAKDGSRTAQEASMTVHELEARVRVLENTQATKEAVATALTSAEHSTSRARSAVLTAVIAAVAALGSVAGALALLIAGH